MSNDKRPPNRRLTQRDIKLWKMLTKDVTRAAGKEYLSVDSDPKPAPPPQHRASRPSNQHPIHSPAKPAAPLMRQQNLDRRTEDRLRKGKIRPEATLDLHGMNQTQAHAALITFVHKSWSAQKRCLLLITGKGEPRLSSPPAPQNPQHWSDPQPGILRRRVPDWQNAPELSPYVLKHTPAQPQDGGTGALYVYLRRNKPTT